jgi:hypothetical protein
VNMAAAVFLQGKLEVSPIDQIFGYFVCRVVSLSTSTKPCAFVNPDSAKKAAGFIVGTK